MENPATPAKKRKMKTTHTQYELYLNMLESNPHFRENKITPDYRTAVADAWKQLVNNLNASGGPAKTLAEWKRVFTDWKCQVRKKARLIKNAAKETGNQGEPEKELSEIEKKLIYLTGEIVIEGIGGVPEIGVENTENIEKSVEEEEKETRETKQHKETEKAAKKSDEKNTLMEINSNLKRLVTIKQKEVELKEQEIEMRRFELRVKYNIVDITVQPAEED